MNLLKQLPIPILLLVSGFCGISYELLYTKLLGNLLGNQFTINATVLLTFLFGIGIGTLYAHRFVRFLWLIELGIGLYALFITTTYGHIDQLVYSSLPSLGTNMGASAAVALVILALPSFLVGCSLPLFAAYLEGIKRLSNSPASVNKNIFATTYGLYNLGAVATALVMEFIILRNMGLTSAMQCLALVNISVAIALRATTYFTGLRVSLSTSQFQFAGKTLVSLFVLSVASAIFQLMMIKIFEFVFGPFNETFALVLAVVLFGISAGAYLVSWTKLSYRGSLLLALFGLLFLLTAFYPITILYAALHPIFSDSYSALVGLKLFVVFTLMLVPAVGFGATVPALLQQHIDVAKDSGKLLFTSSMGNVLGFILMTFFLHQQLDYGPLTVVITALVLLAMTLIGKFKTPTFAAAILLFCLSFGAAKYLWSESLLYISHKNFRSTFLLDNALASQTDIEKYKGAQDVFAIISQHNQPFFFINGYISIPLESPSEKIVGAISSMLAPRTDKALILGVGSGATAGTVGLVFDETDAVEINQVILDNQTRMSKYNFDINKRSNVNLIHDDGIHFVKSTTEEYSLILNTVTSPQFFSSSKLYTVDFFEQVKQKLTPDGIYVTWADSKIGSDGMAVVMESLGQSFDHCALVYIRSNYFLMVCSEAEVSLRQFDKVASNPELINYFSRQNGLPVSFLPYLVLSTDALALQTNQLAPTNRLDFPILEHMMARVAATDMASFHRLLNTENTFNSLSKGMAQGFNWQPGEFLFFAENRLSSNSLKNTLRRLVEEKDPEFEQHYIDAIMSYADTVDSGPQYHHALDNLLTLDECWEAERYYKKVRSKLPENYHGDYQIGKCYYYSDQYQQAHKLFLRQWQNNEYGRAPLYIARSLIRLGEPSAALPWLEKAVKLSSRGEYRADYYFGIAYEQLGQLEAAKRHYQTIVAGGKSDQYQRARQRLKQLASHHDATRDSDNPSNRSNPR